MQTKKIIVFGIMLITLISNVTSAAPPDVKRVQADMELQRIGKNQTNQQDYVPYFMQKPAEAFAILQPYLIDKNEDVRYWTINLVHLLGRNTSDLKTTQQCVLSLIVACTDVASGNRNTAASFLKKYSQNAFTIAATDSLRNIITQGRTSNKHLPRLVGYLGLVDLSTTLKNIISNKAISNRDYKWSARLALARMGDMDELTKCINIVKVNDMGDNLIATLFPDLAYTRQPAAIAYMVEVLNSNDKKCSSPNPDKNEKIFCGYRIMEQLAPIVEGFPIQLGVGGELATKNYEQALITVREWFATNKKYNIINNTY